MNNKLNRPHGFSLRVGRYSLRNNLYLLTTVTNRRKPLLRNADAALICKNAFAYQEQNGNVVSHAWVIMPDHIHWLLELRNGTLSQIMKSVKGYSSRQIGKLDDSIGPPVWQAGFHDHALRSDEDVAVVARYIVMNPVRGCLVENISDYPHWWCKYPL